MSAFVTDTPTIQELQVPETAQEQIHNILQECKGLLKDKVLISDKIKEYKLSLRKAK